MKKKSIIYTLIFTLLLTTVFGTTVFADEVTEETIQQLDAKDATSGSLGDNVTYDIVDGVMTITGTGAMTDLDYSSSYPFHDIRKQIYQVDIGEGITTVASELFLYASNLQSVSLPSTLKSIGQSAFSGTAVKSISFPSGLQSIGKQAFLSTALQNVTIPGGVSFGNSAFSGNTLASVTLEEGVTDIPDQAFYNNKISTLNLPKSLKYIGKSAFASTTSSYSYDKHYIKTVNYAGTKEEWDAVQVESPNEYLTKAKINTTSGESSGEAGTEYTIKYKLNGGTNSENNPTSYTVGSVITLESPSRDGYKFKGWYKDKNFKKKTTGITATTKGNKTFYAKWAKQKYKITYELNGGKNTKSSKKNKKSYYITTKTFKLKSPKKTGYNFTGWYLDEGCTEKVTKIKKGTFGDITLYAGWEEKIVPTNTAS